METTIEKNESEKKILEVELKTMMKKYNNVSATIDATTRLTAEIKNLKSENKMIMSYAKKTEASEPTIDQGKARSSQRKD
eukprot:12943397-Ditylum_brightwellii.AAC.1